MSWKKLQKIYKDDGIFLALGAGVSVASKLPNWQKLIRRLVTIHLDKGDQKLFQDLKDGGLSLPVIASLLEECSSGRSDFIESVREALYRDFPYFPEGVPKNNCRRFVQSIQESNPTLCSVASLCAILCENGCTYKANKQIKAIVTFNLDALLQEYIYARYKKRLLRTIERSSADRYPHKINIYHMHGFLRFDSKAGDPSKEAPDEAILTEQDYFDFFNKPTSLFNYTFLYLLREYSCLFIGLSMEDENIRRLLHYSMKERSRALEREGEISDNRKKLLRHYAVLKSNGIDHVDKAIEDTLERLGTIVLWVDDYKEISRKIKRLHR